MSVLKDPELKKRGNRQTGRRRSDHQKQSDRGGRNPTTNGVASTFAAPPLIASFHKTIKRKLRSFFSAKVLMTISYCQVGFRSERVKDDQLLVSV